MACFARLASASSSCGAPCRAQWAGPSVPTGSGIVANSRCPWRRSAPHALSRGITCPQCASMQSCGFFPTVRHRQADAGKVAAGTEMHANGHFAGTDPFPDCPVFLANPSPQQSVRLPQGSPADKAGIKTSQPVAREHLRAPEPPARDRGRCVRQLCGEHAVGSTRAQWTPVHHRDGSAARDAGWSSDERTGPSSAAGLRAR